MILLGVVFLAGRFFNKRVAVMAALLIATTPFFVFFNRMALVDSMLAAFTIWALYIALCLIKFPRIDLAMLLGYLYGGAMLTKTPALFNILTLPATLITFNFSLGNRPKRIFNLICLWVLALTITFVMYNILRLGQGFSNLGSRNQDYVLSISRILERPWDPLIPRMVDLADFSFHLLGLPFLILLFLGVYKVIVEKNKFGLAILAWSLFPLLIQMEALKTFTARYILSSMVPLTVIASVGLEFIWLKYLSKNLVKQILFLGVLLSWSIFFIFNLLTSPENAPLPKEERAGYFELWTAGYGLRESADYLIDQAKTKGSIVVGTRGYFGTLPEGLEIYLERYNHAVDKSKQIIVQPDNIDIRGSLIITALKHPTFLITNKSQFYPHDLNLSLVKQFPKAITDSGSQDVLLLYQVLP